MNNDIFTKTVRYNPGTVNFAPQRGLDIDDSKIFGAVYSPAPIMDGVGNFMAGVGYGDDLHLRALVQDSAYPLIHEGYFYLPYKEYYLSPTRMFFLGTVSGSGDFGTLDIYNAPYPSTDLAPVLTLYDCVATGEDGPWIEGQDPIEFEGEYDFVGIRLPLYNYEIINNELGNLDNFATIAPNSFRNINVINSRRDNLKERGWTPSGKIDDELRSGAIRNERRLNLNTKIRTEARLAPYSPDELEIDLDSYKFWIRNYEPPVGSGEIDITPCKFRKRVDLTGKRTFYKDANDNIFPYEFELDIMEYELHIVPNDLYCHLHFKMHQGYVGEKIYIEYSYNNFYVDTLHTFNPQNTPIYAGKFYSITQADQYVSKIDFIQVNYSDEKPNNIINLIATVYDQFGGPVVGAEVLFGYASIPGHIYPEGHYICDTGIYTEILVETQMDGTALAQYIIPEDWHSPRGIVLQARCSGVTQNLPIHLASSYRKQKETYWFQADLSTLDCRQARSAIGQGFFSTYGKSPVTVRLSPIPHLSYVDLKYDGARWFYAFDQEDYTELPLLFQDFGSDDIMLEELHSYKNFFFDNYDNVAAGLGFTGVYILDNDDYNSLMSGDSVGEVDDLFMSNLSKIIHGIYAIPKRFGVGKNAPTYTYYQAYYRPPIPYINQKGEWVFPDLLNWYTIKDTPDEVTGVWNIYDFLAAIYAGDPLKYANIELIFDKFLDRCYVTKDGMWGQELVIDDDHKYKVMYTTVQDYLSYGTFESVPQENKIDRGEVLKIWDGSILSIKRLLSDSALWDGRSLSRKNKYQMYTNITPGIVT